MNYQILKSSSIFNGLSETEIKTIIKHTGSNVKKYRKDEAILLSGDIINDICIVISGSVRIENNDIWGNKSILSIAEQGEVFAEAYACVPNEPLMVDAVSNELCEIMFFNVPTLFSLPESDEKNKLIKNLIMVSSRKNLHLSQRIFHTSSKTIRGRVLSYLSQQSSKQHSQFITIPFNRQQLADYLSLDRSALSKELSKMKADGLIDYHKSTFKLNI